MQYIYAISITAFYFLHGECDLEDVDNIYEVILNIFCKILRFYLQSGI